MRKVSLIPIIALFLCMMYSCGDGIRCTEGVICDSITKQPIGNVRCVILSGKDEDLGRGIQYSNSDGKYSICMKYGGFGYKLPDMKVTFSKDGYETKHVTNPKIDEIIYLEQEER